MEPAVRHLLLRLRGDLCEGDAALLDVTRYQTPAQARGGIVGLAEHVMCAVEVRGPAAGDEPAGPADVGAGEEQRRAETLLDLRGGLVVAPGLLVALQGRASTPSAEGIKP